MHTFLFLLLLTLTTHSPLQGAFGDSNSSEDEDYKPSTKPTQRLLKKQNQRNVKKTFSYYVTESESEEEREEYTERTNKNHNSKKRKTVLASQSSNQLPKLGDILLPTNIRSNELNSATTDLQKIVCFYCQEDFFTQEALTLHETTCTYSPFKSTAANISQFQCPHCPLLRYDNQRGLNRHLKDSHKDNNTSSNNSSLAHVSHQHYETKAPAQLLECHECKLHFESQNSFTAHQKLLHNKKTEQNNLDTTIERIDSNIFNSRTISSQIISTPATGFQCNICQRSFKCPKALASHKSKLQDGKHNIKTPQQNNLDTTIERIDSSIFTTKKFRCDKCNDSFKTPTGLNIHKGVMKDGKHTTLIKTAGIIAASTNEPISIHTCPTCDKICLGDKQWQDHQKNHLKTEIKTDNVNIRLSNINKAQTSFPCILLALYNDTVDHLKIFEPSEKKSILENINEQIKKFLEEFYFIESSESSKTVVKYHDDSTEDTHFKEPKSFLNYLTRHGKILEEYTCILNKEANEMLKPILDSLKNLIES